MRIYGWEQYVTDKSDKSCDHKHCDGGDIQILICHVTSHKHIFKGLCEFMGGTLSQ